MSAALLATLILIGSQSAAAHTQAAQAPAEWPQFRGTPTLTGVTSASMPATLKVKWTFEAGDAVESSAAIAGGVAYVGSQKGELLALDVATGKPKWATKMAGPAYGAPVVVNDLVIETGFEGGIFALDAKTGGEVWQGALPAGTNSGAIVSGDTLLAPAGLPVAEGQTPELVAFRLGG
jgi:outer membrane protein assembly factor BamB